MVLNESAAHVNNMTQNSKLNKLIKSKDVNALTRYLASLDDGAMVYDPFDPDIYYKKAVGYTTTIDTSGKSTSRPTGKSGWSEYHTPKKDRVNITLFKDQDVAKYLIRSFERSTKKTESKLTEAYGTTPISAGVKDVMKTVFSKAASNPEKFIHFLGVAWSDACFDDSGNLKDEKLTKEFSDYIESLSRGMRGMIMVISSKEVI